MANKEKKPVQVGLDPILYAITNVNMGFSEEVFDFLIVSGNQARQFRSSPKHAKRIYLLLKQLIEQYEKKFGELKTELPKRVEYKTPEQKTGFLADLNK